MESGFTLFFVVSLAVTLAVASSSRKSAKGLPGPQRLPCIGNLHQLPKEMYGKSIPTGEQNTVMISSSFETRL
ncbi:hypothetical protein B0H17DRAFT_482489 [Mycena rosella]|uniref:Uncharacterized protein n=1 Tax=Mycena rosella TaxID=1033263 RepID=A0AAD7GKY4_MYCRO|nr:hypothetical protein B0H17DRAFT_482489 [Mycena rosella]